MLEYTKCRSLTVMVSIAATEAASAPTLARAASEKRIMSVVCRKKRSLAGYAVIFVRGYRERERERVG